MRFFSIFRKVKKKTGKKRKSGGKNHLVADLERADGPDLELPLAGHDLGVDAGDDEAGLDARILFIISVFPGFLGFRGPHEASSISE